MCLGKKSGQREGERVLGQGDQGGGDPAGRAAEVNAGPVPFLIPLAERQRWSEFFPRHTLGLRDLCVKKVRDRGFGFRALSRFSRLKNPIRL